MKLRAAALALAALVLAGALSACKGEEQVIYEEEVRAVNDGKPARLAVEYDPRDKSGLLAELQEIAKKYQADYPQTEIQFVERNASIEGGGTPDIVIDPSRQNVDLAEYADFWASEGNLSAGANYAMHQMGRKTVYSIPMDIQQNLLFYRKDWIDAFNYEGNKTAAEKVNVETWKRLLEFPEKLGEKGQLAISQELSGYLFNAILWSNIGFGGMADPAAPYYAPGEECETIFTSEKALESAELFCQVYQVSIEGGALTQEQAVQRFLNGEAAAVIADASLAETLSETMEENTWRGVGLPTGDSGAAIVSCGWWGLGVSDQSEEQEKAIHFLCYLTSADNNIHLAATCGTLPLYKEALMMEPQLKNSPRLPEITLLNQAGYSYTGEPQMFQGFSPSHLENGLYGQGLAQLLAGETSAQALLEKADQTCKEIYRQHIEAGGEIPWLMEEEE